MTKEEWKRSWPAWIRATFIGFPFGTVPAGGSEIPTFLSYATEKKLAKGEDPHKVLEALSHGLTNKLMHGPTRYLNQAEGEHKAEVGQFVQQLFNLPRQG